MPRIILHIGAGKCGSSALQNFLSQNPILPLKSGGRLLYSAVLADGTVLNGRELKARALKRLTGYITSTHLSRLAPLGKMIQFDAAPEDIVILSNEGWRKEWDRLKVQDALSIFGRVEAIMYIRPQTSYVNSAYWQWGAWGNKTFEDWLDSFLPQSLWLTSMKGWSHDSRVGRLTTRLVQNDIVEDFLGWVGVDLSLVKDYHMPSANKSLPDTILRVLQRHRHLRPGPHDSSIDFVLERHFGTIGNGPAWILSEDSIARIVEYTREDNEAILPFLSAHQAALMQEDRRWWDPVVPDRNIESPHPQPPIDNELDSIMAIAFEQLYRSALDKLEQNDSTTPGSVTSDQ